MAISTPTKFHLFDLADALQESGNLAALYTAVPSWTIPARLRTAARTFPPAGVAIKIADRLRPSSLRRVASRVPIDLYDRWTARHIEPADVVVTLSGRGLRTLKRAKGFRSLAVCDRGSTHIVHQEGILAEEHKRWAVRYDGIDPKGIRRELEEYERADLITVPSAFARDTYIQHGVDEKKVVVVPYGIDLATFHPANQPSRVFRVLYVGRISLQKGVPYLLEAVQGITLPRFEVRIVGQLEPPLKSILAEHGTASRLVPHTSRAELVKEYNEASVLVVPSVQEGLARVILEGMACGLPIIATPNSGAEEFIDDGKEGYIVQARSPDAIREKLISLCEHPGAREEMGRAALGKVRAVGGKDAYASRALAAYTVRSETIHG